LCRDVVTAKFWTFVAKTTKFVLLEVKARTEGLQLCLNGGLLVLSLVLIVVLVFLQRAAMLALQALY